MPQVSLMQGALGVKIRGIGVKSEESFYVCHILAGKVSSTCGTF